MFSNDNLAIAAHLHVLLRRKTGRVTDTEWMASDRAYAFEIVRFSRAKAIEENAPDLADWATKLERAMDNPGAPARQTLAALANQAVKQLSPDGRTAAPTTTGTTPFRQHPNSADSGVADSRLDTGAHQLADQRTDPDAPRYIKSLR